MATKAEIAEFLIQEFPQTLCTVADAAQLVETYALRASDALSAHGSPA